MLYKHYKHVVLKCYVTGRRFVFINCITNNTTGTVFFVVVFLHSYIYTTKPHVYIDITGSKIKRILNTLRNRMQVPTNPDDLYNIVL